MCKHHHGGGKTKDQPAMLGSSNELSEGEMGE